MKSSSGYAKTDSEWPKPIIAIPRGIREWFWHGATAALTLSVLAMRGGWYLILCTALVAWTLQLDPRRMYSLGIIWCAIALAASTLAGQSITEILTALYITSAQNDSPDSWSKVAHVALVANGAAWTVATLLAFDRRRVNRALVDSRVWDRQTLRRKQLLRSWARNRTVPEVKP